MNLSPRPPRLGHGFSSAGRAGQAAARSRFGGAPDAAGWRKAFAICRGQEGPVFVAPPGTRFPPAGASGRPRCCREPAESSVLLLGFPRASARCHVAALAGAARPHLRARLVSNNAGQASE